MDDIADDIADDIGQWLTYGQIATARNIKREAAIRLVQRHRWRRQAGNDGFARVLVPHDWLKPNDRQSGDDVARDVAPDVAGVQEAVRAAIEALQAAKDGEIRVWRERTEGAEAARERAEARADRAELTVAAERGRANALRDRVEQSQAELVAEQAAKEAAEKALAAFQQSDAARRALGRLARLRAAWRGE